MQATDLQKIEVSVPLNLEIHSAKWWKKKKAFAIRLPQGGYIQRYNVANQHKISVILGNKVRLQFAVSGFISRALMSFESIAKKIKID
jgi:hypothetical protein